MNQSDAVDLAKRMAIQGKYRRKTIEEFERLRRTGLRSTEIRAIKNHAVASDDYYIAVRLYFLICEYERMAQEDSRLPSPGERPLFNERDEVEAGIEFNS